MPSSISLPMATRMTKTESVDCACGITLEMTLPEWLLDAARLPGHVRRYWYRNGCLFPDMMTVFIALDKCTRENGCLQILSGSHLCGRVDHGVVGRQIGADADRVAEISKVCEHLYIELNPGDALYFHGNVIHTSSANNSDTRRWAFLCAYNKASNNPVKEHLHPHYTPLTQVADTAIMECSVPWDSTGKDLVTKDRRERFVMAS